MPVHGTGRVRRLLLVGVPAAASELPAGAFVDGGALYAAVDAWVADPAAAEATHGSISGWDTSRVDDMSGSGSPDWDGFFPSSFDAQIGGWDTSKVTDMGGTFYDAESFNQALDWDTSSVTKSGMSSMFHNTALESDECSKAKMWEAWNGVDAFNVNEYNDWSAYSVSADC